MQYGTNPKRRAGQDRTGSSALEEDNLSIIFD